MISSLKRNLILITALVYLVFACNYVLLCRRNTRVINLMECFYPQKSQIKTTHSTISSANQRHLLHNFLSRPRVISNPIFSIEFSLTIITLLFLSGCCNLRNQSLGFLRNKYLSYLHTDIKFYQCWRI
jgi:hypothetical protein